ncbi:uncharacterized protein LOC142644136 [Castanea sativa]|uniref:uncharacterized protein LOC142644136 n=1 Tax=Castanea sativa TaxID=21020 RepID=UPI003F650F88
MEWRDKFLRATVHHLAVPYSDHDLVLLDMESWSQAQPRGSPVYRLFEKKKKCRLDLIAWSRQTFGNTRTKLDAKQRELAALVQEGYGQNVESINGVRKEIRELLHQEEVFWQQRSRSIWLLAGDKNTKFFHQRASQRRRKNNIEGLHDRDGVWQIGVDRVANIAKEYYKNLFTSSNRLDMERVIESVDHVVMEEMGQSLVRPYTKEEVKTALF